MIDINAIRVAVHSILSAGMSNYTVVRNEPENMDPNIAAQNNGWVNVHGGGESFRPYRTGTRPWLGTVSVDVRVHVANMNSGEAVDEGMQTAKKTILDLIDTNRNLLGTVSIVTGYDVVYEQDIASDIYEQKAIISITAEVRS